MAKFRSNPSSCYFCGHHFCVAPLMWYIKSCLPTSFPFFRWLLFYGLNQCYCRFHMIITRISYKSEFALCHLYPSCWKTYMYVPFSCIQKYSAPNLKSTFNFAKSLCKPCGHRFSFVFAVFVCRSLNNKLPCNFLFQVQ